MFHLVLTKLGLEFSLLWTLPSYYTWHCWDPPHPFTEQPQEDKLMLSIFYDCSKYLRLCCKQILLKRVLFTSLHIPTLTSIMDTQYHWLMK